MIMTSERKIKVLHISAHLGGGVGRVLSKVFGLRRQNTSQIKERFICIEAPQDIKYVHHLVEAGADIIVSPDQKTTCELILWADIVQVEWWHHPLLPFFYARSAPSTPDWYSGLTSLAYPTHLFPKN